MKVQDKAFYSLGIAVAALAGLLAAVPPRGVHNEWISPPYISGATLPAMLNSLDTTCGNVRRCTDFEFNDMVSDLQKQWAITPQWVRSECAANATVPSMERCIVNRTRAWLGKNANRQAPWVRPDALGAVAQYSGT
jgi:hypothetical protein